MVTAIVIIAASVVFPVLMKLTAPAQNRRKWILELRAFGRKLICR